MERQQKFSVATTSSANSITRKYFRNGTRPRIRGSCLPSRRSYSGGGRIRAPSCGQTRLRLRHRPSPVCPKTAAAGSSLISGDARRSPPVRRGFDQARPPAARRDTTNRGPEGAAGNQGFVAFSAIRRARAGPIPQAFVLDSTKESKRQYWFRPGLKHVLPAAHRWARGEVRHHPRAVPQVHVQNSISARRASRSAADGRELRL